MRRWASIALLVLVGLAGASCNRTSSKAAGRLTVDGKAEVTAVSGEQREVSRSRTLRSGEQVRMINGTAQLGLGNGRQLELREGTTVRLAVQQGDAGGEETRGELVSGDVLVLATEQPAALVAADTTVRVNGIARVSRTLAVVVAAYQGAAGVETAGRSASVPALRQVTVPAPGLPSRATPIVFSAEDSWDQRYLGDAIELSNELVARSRGFTAQLTAGEGTTPAFFRQVLPDLARQPFDATYLDPNRPAGETLVGTGIALLGTKGEFPNRFASVMSFHEDGAPWGFVALDQGVERRALLETIDGAINRLPGRGSQLAAPPAPPSPASPGTTVPVPVPTTPTTIAPSGGTAGGGAGAGAGAGGATGAGGAGATGTAGTGTTGTAGSNGTPAGPTTPGATGAINLGIPLVDNTLNAVIDTLSGLLNAVQSP